MTEHLHNLIESLREELRHYGELLALLETHRAQVARGPFAALVPTAEAINSQANTIKVACRERAQRYRDLARSLALPPDSRVGYLLPLIPQAHRPLLEALLEENHALFRRVRERARKNHHLLSRSLDLVEQFMGSFSHHDAPIPVRKRGTASRPPAKPC